MHDPVTPAAQRGAHNPAALLAIDTAGSGCSAAVARGATVLAAERQALRHGHAEVLLPMIDRVVAASGVAREQIGIVAAAVGPGGFTGIRVGLAAASGIALALGARPIGVTSFAAVAAAAARQVDPACSPLLVALDSRRAELYVQLFALTTRNKSAVPLDAPQALPPDRLADYLADRIGRGAAPLLAGDAAEAAAALLDAGPSCRVLAGSAPDALGVAAAALPYLDDPSGGSSLRPLYLRPPDVSFPEPGRNRRRAAATLS